MDKRLYLLKEELLQELFQKIIPGKVGRQQ